MTAPDSRSSTTPSRSQDVGEQSAKGVSRLEWEVNVGKEKDEGHSLVSSRGNETNERIDE